MSVTTQSIALNSNAPCTHSLL